MNQNGHTETVHPLPDPLALPESRIPAPMPGSTSMTISRAPGNSTISFVTLMPSKMDWNNGLRLFCDSLFDLVGVDIDRILFNICEYGSASAIENTVGGGRESDRRSDHLIASRYSRCEARDMQRRCPVGNGDCIFRTGELTEGVFEFFDFGPLRDPV
jgi:hypothetical protein